MLLTENSQKWSQIIKEELGVKDENKLSWMSKYAQVHEIKDINLKYVVILLLCTSICVLFTYLNIY